MLGIGYIPILTEVAVARLARTTEEVQLFTTHHDQLGSPEVSERERPFTISRRSYDYLDDLYFYRVRLDSNGRPTA